jgi:hypothetical protein
MPVANLVEQIAIQGMNRGWGGRDSSVTFLLQEEQAGVKVRAAGVDPVKAGRFISTHPEVLMKRRPRSGAALSSY